MTTTTTPVVAIGFVVSDVPGEVAHQLVGASTRSSNGGASGSVDRARVD